MEWIIVWLVMGGVVALVANSKGKSGIAWFIYGALIWPIALTHILVSKSESVPDARGGAAASESRVSCIHCAEMILPAAKICPHCRQPLELGWAAGLPMQDGRSVVALPPQLDAETEEEYRARMQRLGYHVLPASAPRGATS